MIGLSLVALMAGTWLGELLMSLGTTPADAVSPVVNLVVRWIPAVRVGAAIAWGGQRTPGRVAAAIGSLLLLWIVPAGITAVTSAAGSRVLLPHPAEMLDYGLGVLRAALFEPDLVLPPLLVALPVAAALTAAPAVATRGLGQVRRAEVGRGSSKPVAALAGATLGFAVLAFAFRDGKAVSYPLVAPTILMALLLAFVLVGTRWPLSVAWVAVAVGLALLPLTAADVDPASGANDVVGCGSVLDPEAILLAPTDLREIATRECTAALQRQERIVLLLAVPPVLALVAPPLVAAARRTRTP